MTIRAVSGNQITTTVSKMNRGVATPTADGILTAFTIAHGLGAAPTWADATVGNALSNTLKYITYDATNITVTYAVAPLAGTLSLNWIAVV